MNFDLSYEEYEEHFNLSPARRVPEERFFAALHKAVCFLSTLTFGRIRTAEPTEDTVACLCELAELFYEDSMRQGLKSETADGYSACYDEESSVMKRAADIAALYLSGSGLLFQGVAQ